MKHRGATGLTSSLFLNHLTSPHVLIASAVQASCSLPGLMTPTPLYRKNHNGEIVPFVSQGICWVDGSITNDIPVRRLGEIYNATTFIVVQNNPVCTIYDVLTTTWILYSSFFLIE